NRTETSAIPTVNISAFLDPNASIEARQDVVQAVSQACYIYGFFNLIGHGISQEALYEALELNKMFFALPEESKREVLISKSLGWSFCGYEPPGIQTHHKGLCLTSKRMLALVKNILAILAQGLPKEWECSPTVFDSLLEKTSIPMHLLHYRPVPSQLEDAQQFGVADHTDFGCVSILLQEPGTSGLEVYYPPTDSWVPVPVIEDRSACHRVLTNRERHRYSVAFFLNGNLSLKAKALDRSGTETMVGDWIHGCLIETIGQTGKLLQREAST
ncbi:hypothetical protein V491_09149, partial [Pseudogymnoascus sp. VKM F-3775]